MNSQTTTQAITILIQAINADLNELTNFTHNKDKTLNAYAHGAQDALTLVKHELEAIISNTTKPTPTPKQTREKTPSA